jgi:catechol 2,3-dioxygenase-like lactoylglutathione lyase family enzyme
MLQNFPMFAYILAKDLTRARQFYEKKLGFTVKAETAELPRQVKPLAGR